MNREQNKNKLSLNREPDLVVDGVYKEGNIFKQMKKDVYAPLKAKLSQINKCNELSDLCVGFKPNERVRNNSDVRKILNPGDEIQYYLWLPSTDENHYHGQNIDVDYKIKRLSGEEIVGGKLTAYVLEYPWNPSQQSFRDPWY